MLYQNSAGRCQIHGFSRRTSGGQLGCNDVRVKLDWCITPPAFTPQRCFPGWATITLSAPLTSTVVKEALESQCCRVILSSGSLFLPPKALFTRTLMTNRTHGKNFYRYLFSVACCIHLNTSSKWLQIIIFHEFSSQPATFGKSLRLLDSTFHKSPPDIAIFEPRTHYFPNSISTTGLS